MLPQPIALLLCVLAFGGILVGGYFLAQHPEGNDQPIDTASSTMSEPPRFEDYQTTIIDPRLARSEVDWSSNPDAQMFKTAISRGMLAGPVFAGKYALASWGCGTSCQGNALMDVQTGAVVVFGVPSAYGLGYRLESALLVVNPAGSMPSPEDAGIVTTDYYVMEEGTLRLLEKRDAYGRVLACESTPVEYSNPQTNESKHFESACEVPFGWVPKTTVEGMLTGKVTIGPLCPIESEEVPCDVSVSKEQYEQVVIVVLDRTGIEIVERTNVASDGTYALSLAPGTYVIDIERRGIAFSKALPRKITIPANSGATFDFSIDTGIR